MLGLSWVKRMFTRSQSLQSNTAAVALPTYAPPAPTYPPTWRVPAGMVQTKTSEVQSAPIKPIKVRKKRRVITESERPSMAIVAFGLRELHNLSFKEIGERLDLSETTAHILYWEENERRHAAPPQVELPPAAIEAKPSAKKYRHSTTKRDRADVRVLTVGPMIDVLMRDQGMKYAEVADELNRLKVRGRLSTSAWTYEAVRQVLARYRELKPSSARQAISYPNHKVSLFDGAFANV